MKFGFRTPSLKKSIKSKTTGRIKRSVKKKINPYYGQKGVGYIKNPSKALKNSIYHKTTFDITQPLKTPNEKKHQKCFNEKNTLNTRNHLNNKETNIVNNNISKPPDEKIKLSPRAEKFTTIFAYIIATIIIGYILILIIHFIIGIIQGLFESF